MVQKFKDMRRLKEVIIKPPAKPTKIIIPHALYSTFRNKN
jgi:hypothetical protein